MSTRRLLHRAAFVVLGIVVVATVACSPQDDLATFNTKMFYTPIGTAISEWKAKHAEVIGVSVANIETRWNQGGGLLDTPAAKGYWFDLSTDFCSFSPDTALYFNFKAPCVRHDFGWRNLKKLDRHWNCAGASTNQPCANDGGSLGAYYKSSNKLIVNDQFKRDMDEHCRTRSVWFQGQCFDASMTYYLAVNAVA